MDISVVIPVFNNAPYVEKCIMSAVTQEKVTSVIVINDGSSDGSTKIIEKLGQRFQKIISKAHPSLENLGRSASRNLGIANALTDWIAFLDADDFYLSNRFAHLPDKPPDDVDGYYDDIETEYLQQDYREVFPDHNSGVSDNIAPGLLLDHLICHDTDHISLNGLLVRKAACVSTGSFDTNLETGEDTDFVWRLAAPYRLVAGGSKHPVAIRRVHGSNTFFNKDLILRNRAMFYAKWHREIDNYNVSAKAKKIIKQKSSFYQKKKDGKSNNGLSFLRSIARHFVKQG